MISQRPCWEHFHDVGLLIPYTAICKRHRPVRMIINTVSQIKLSQWSSIAIFSYHCTERNVRFLVSGWINDMSTSSRALSTSFLCSCNVWWQNICLRRVKTPQTEQRKIQCGGSFSAFVTGGCSTSVVVLRLLTHGSERHRDYNNSELNGGLNGESSRGQERLATRWRMWSTALPWVSSVTCELLDTTTTTTTTKASLKSSKALKGKWRLKLVHSWKRRI